MVLRDKLPDGRTEGFFEYWLEWNEITGKGFSDLNSAVTWLLSIK